MFRRHRLHNMRAERLPNRTKKTARLNIERSFDQTAQQELHFSPEEKSQKRYFWVTCLHKNNKKHNLFYSCSLYNPPVIMSRWSFFVSFGLV